MTADPPVRADGCRGPRNAHRRSKPLYREQAEADPFCSTACARAFHGCPLPAATETRARRRAAREAAQRFRAGRSSSHPFRAP